MDDQDTRRAIVGLRMIVYALSVPVVGLIEHSSAISMKLPGPRIIFEIALLVLAWLDGR